MPDSRTVPDFHGLVPDVIIAVVEQALGQRCTNLCRPLNSYVNRVYELELEEGGAVVAKFYRPGRWSLDALRDEHDFLRELAERDIPVIPPLTLAGGGTLGRHGEIHFTVFPKRRGRLRDEFTLDEWEEIGRLLGRVHAVGAMHRTRDRLVLTPGQATARNLRVLAGGGFIPPGLAESYRVVADRLLALIGPIFEGMEILRIHGDCHFSNLIHRPGESFFVIDFDDMVEGPPVQDLWMLLPGRAQEAGAEIETFLEGYETFRPFDRRSLRLIEPLRAMRYIHYSAWCAIQAADGSFSRLDPDWGTEGYWRREIHDLETQIQQIRESLDGDALERGG